MATPTLTLINAGGGTLTDGFVGVNADAESATGWTDFATLDTDIKLQGSNSISGIGRANNEDMYYDSNGADITAVGKVFRAWFNTVNVAYMGTLAGANPYELYISDGTTDARMPFLGSDTYEGGWVYAVQDMDLVTTGNGWSASPTLANIDQWGWTTGHDSNAKNVINCWADAFRYMDGYSFTGGTSGDKVTIADLFTADMGGATPSAYGIVQRSRGIYFGSGTVQIGSGATTTWFSCVGEVWQFLDTVGDLAISAGLYEVSAVGTGCDAVISGSVIRGPATGATTRVYYDFSDTDATVTFTNNLIVDGGTVVFASGQTATGNTFDDCLQITHGGADMSGSTVQGYEGTTDTAALLYDVATDPDGEMDDMEFYKGTAATHAIEFGSSAPSTTTLRGILFSGYNAVDGNNDSALYFPDTGSDVAWVVNLVACTGDISYKKVRAGDTVSLVVDPVTLTLTVTDRAGTPISGARAYVAVTSAAGGWPYQDSVTITSSSTTATVTHTAHGLSTNDWVYIAGATNDEDYNGTFQITVTGVNTYTYTMPGTAASPATGTITSTFVVIQGTTNGSGVISATYSYAADQPVSGRVRSATTGPYYRTSPLTGTIDSAAGLSITVQMILDQ